MSQFAEVFYPALREFWYKRGTKPTYCLLGAKETEIFDRDLMETRFRVEDATCRTRKYADVEILTTFDVDSLIHFFNP